MFYIINIKPRKIQWPCASCTFAMSSTVTRDDVSPDCGSQGSRFESNQWCHLWQDINLYLPLPTQVK